MALLIQQRFAMREQLHLIEVIEKMLGIIPLNRYEHTRSAGHANQCRREQGFQGEGCQLRTLAIRALQLEVLVRIPESGHRFREPNLTHLQQFGAQCGPVLGNKNTVQ
ncbi:hypothetical protein D9M72_602930 [compost metagenome]